MAATIKVPTIFTAEDKFSRVVDRMTAKTTKFQKRLDGMEKTNKRLNQFKYQALAGAVALGATVKVATDFEDKMADISKTTGIKDLGLKKLGADILKLAQDTRTSIPDIQEISRIGGQLGVAETGILSFTKSANKFNVALGEDYSGGVEEAVLSVGKINSLFKDTRKLSIDDHITRIGSSFNSLSSSGKATSSNINDFVLRVGTLPDVLKGSATATAGLGAFLEEVGINSERGASGFSTLLLKAGKELPKFAAQMNMTTESARDLLSQDPIKFAQKFSRSLSKLSPDKLALKLKDLGVGGQESIKVVGALGTETDRLAVLMKLSTNEFKKGTSILDEYNIKNETTAANLAKSKNNFEALGITIGTKLAPVINKLIGYFIPLVQGMSSFIERNDWVVATLPVVIGLFVAFKLGLILMRAAMIANNVVMGIQAARVGAMSIAMKGNVIAQAVFKTAMLAGNAATWIATASTTAFGIALNLSIWPITLIVAAIIGLIALVMNWGAVTDWLGEKWKTFMGWISGLWSKIVILFDEFSFVDYFKDIGTSIMSYMLFPLRSVLGLLANLPGKVGKMASSAIETIDKVTGEVAVKNEVLPSTSQASTENLNKNINQNSLSIDIKDKGNNIAAIETNGKNNDKMKLSTTVGAF